MANFDTNSGALISANDAAKMLQDYMTAHGIDPANPDPNVCYGYAFGLNTLKDMIKEIDSYNAGSSTPEIIGVRVYKCLNKYDGKTIEDVFLIPITAANTDLYPVRTSTTIVQTTPNIILDQSLPCPNCCGN